MYPRINIDLKKINENIQMIKEITESRNIEIFAVTKAVCADEKIVDLLVYNGIRYLADARLTNLENIKSKEIKKVLLRLPSQSEVERVVKSTDISLNSTISTISLLNDEAKKLNKKHEIILMIELGDLREGIKPEEVLTYAEKIFKFDNINLKGLGVNLTCYGAVIPTPDKLDILIDLKNSIKEKFSYDIDIISGGNSSSLHLLKKDIMPLGINNLRIGETYLLGTETAYGKSFMYMNTDSFSLDAEIIEYYDKESIPNGLIGMDAFGNKVEYEDKGIIRRGILAIGRQDVNPNDIVAFDRRLEILGASSDHLIINFEKAKDDYSIGDIVRFKLNYGSLLDLYTSKYVSKNYIE